MFNVLGRITELRKARGWSNYSLAKRSGIPQSTIATWYKRELCPSIEKIEILCDTFGITLKDFFTEPQQGNNINDEITRKLPYLSIKQKETLSETINYMIH